MVEPIRKSKWYKAIEFKLSITQGLSLFFVCILALRVFSVLHVNITYLDYAGSLTYPAFDFNPCKNSHTVHENIKLQRL